jgi:hypothetical protein
MLDTEKLSKWMEISSRRVEISVYGSIFSIGVSDRLGWELCNASSRIHSSCISSIDDYAAPF